MKLILQMVLQEGVKTTGRLRIIGGTAIDRIVGQLGINRNLIVSFLWENVKVTGWTRERR